MQTLAIEGKLTIFTAAKQKGLLLGFLQFDDELEINLSSITEMDMAGLQLLILLKHEAEKAKKSLRFVRHSPAVLDILAFTRLTAIFCEPVIPTRHHEF